MPPTPEQLRALQRLLGEELEAVEEMARVLSEEYRALSGGEPQEISAATEHKREALDRLARRSTQRGRFLRAAGLPVTDRALADRLRGTPASNVLLELLHRLQQGLEEVRRQNRINGGIVSLGQRHARQAIGILSGRSRESDTYGPRGEQRNGADPNPLAKV
ncbi:MAG: flagellar protein FlgN [gamma proteobacterium symbiont of Phacoides pectinatus]